MLPRNPDDNSPSKSAFITNHFVSNGTEYTMEVRSEYDGGNNQRIGEITVWKGFDNQGLTARLHEQDA